MLAALLLALMATACLAASAQAETYTAGTTEDLTGVCANPASGTCSLRQLVEYEDSLPPHKEAPDAIVLPAGRYDLTHGALLITQTLVIVGAGARVTDLNVPVGIPAQRVLEVKTPESGGEEPSVVILATEISGGTANESNGGKGGDIYNSALLLLTEDWVTAGTASSGGGVSNDAGTLFVQRSLVSGNHANLGEGDSGGIQNHGSACASACPGKRAILAIENSTITHNDARLGAGVFSWSDAEDNNEVSVIDSTIAYNSTQDENCAGCGGSSRGSGAGLKIDDGTAIVVGSLLAFNTYSTPEEVIPSNCTSSIEAKITSFGYNLESGADCGFQKPGDIQNASPVFSSSTPQNNGGNTDTLYPEPYSPGVNAIPAENSFCSGYVDQRDVSRPQGPGCDMGAVEYGNAPPPAPAPVTPPPPAAAPTLTGTAPPSILTNTSATFTTTVNPHGLPTTVHFEYGGVFGGASIAAITYGLSTPNQSVTPDFADHTVTATVTGLLPNVTYHVRAVATNGLGTSQGADQILQTAADPPPPPPVLGKTANVAPVSGVVYIELPPGATLASSSRVPLPGQGSSVALSGESLNAPLPAQAFIALSKGRNFIPLTEARQIPLGSTLDTSKGVVRITTATTAAHKGALQAGDFGAGLFKLLQKRKERGLTELNIIDNLNERQICASTGKGKKATAAASHLSSKVLGHLRANSHGHFTARGKYSAATVRGTVWGVENRCDGTLTRVTRGVLSVRDFRKRKTITLFTGQTYLARAPRH
jgi:hypothetical protein